MRVFECIKKTLPKPFRDPKYSVWFLETENFVLIYKDGEYNPTKRFVPSRSTAYGNNKSCVEALAALKIIEGFLE